VAWLPSLVPSVGPAWLAVRGNMVHARSKVKNPRTRRHEENRVRPGTLVENVKLLCLMVCGSHSLTRGSRAAGIVLFQWRTVGRCRQTATPQDQSAAVIRGLPGPRRAFEPSNLRATSLRYQARIVSGLATVERYGELVGALGPRRASGAKPLRIRQAPNNVVIVATRPGYNETQATTTRWNSRGN
jgi:hypothetical protein